MEMDDSIYIRPLLISDASKTFLWSNDPDLWKFSKVKWNPCPHMEIEVNWMRFLLEKTTDKYFAICMNLSDQHIGNLQLTNITNQAARCCVIIGEKLFWGRGLAVRAIMLMADYAFRYKKLKRLSVEIHSQNTAALYAYKKCGFVECKKTRGAYNLFRLDREHYFIIIGGTVQ